MTTMSIVKRFTAGAGRAENRGHSVAIFLTTSTKCRPGTPNTAQNGSIVTYYYFYGYTEKSAGFYTCTKQYSTDSGSVRLGSNPSSPA